MATYWRYGRKYYMGFVGNLLGFPAVKEFWKSVKNGQSYCPSLVYYFFWDTVYIHLYSPSIYCRIYLHYLIGQEIDAVVKKNSAKIFATLFIRVWCRRGYKSRDFFTNISLYLGNDTRQTSSTNRNLHTPPHNAMSSIDLEWLWMTATFWTTRSFCDSWASC